MAPPTFLEPEHMGSTSSEEEEVVESPSGASNMGRSAAAGQKRRERDDRLINHLRDDPGILASSDPAELKDLFYQVSMDSNKREFLQLLATSDAPSAVSFVADLPPEWQIQFNLFAAGLPIDAQADPTVEPVVPQDPSAPFTGVGATGVNGSAGSMDLLDAVKMATSDEAVKHRYSNPMTGNPWYLADLETEEMEEQANILLEQPVSSNYAEGYAGTTPSRADVIQAAASKYNLEPELIAAFILTEQRDQSQNEDVAEYFAARLPVGGQDTSVGLAQIMTYNASFASGLIDESQIPDSRRGAAHMLASDEVSIFACAQYLRELADSVPSESEIPLTTEKFPDIDLAVYAENSASWPRDNIIVLGSEYTSTPWDDKLFASWGRMVYGAYKQIKGQGIF